MKVIVLGAGVIGTTSAWFLAKSGHEVTVIDRQASGFRQTYQKSTGDDDATIGRKSFSDEQLKTNLVALIDALNKAKPASSKGVYLRKVAISSTMGAGVRVDHATLAA